MPANDLASLDLVEVKDGTRVRVRVQPRARRNAIVGVHGGALRVTVTAPAERGKANESVIALLAETLGVSRSAVVLEAGAGSRTKTVVVALDSDSVRRRLEENQDVRS